MSRLIQATAFLKVGYPMRFIRWDKTQRKVFEVFPISPSGHVGFLGESFGQVRMYLGWGIQCGKGANGELSWSLEEICCWKMTFDCLAYLRSDGFRAGGLGMLC